MFLPRLRLASTPRPLARLSRPTPLTQLQPIQPKRTLTQTALRRMPVELKGSCHCGAVRFSLQSSTPVPYQLCLCSICRKVGGVGGSINLGGHTESLKIEGKENLSVYKAVLNRDTPEEKIASSERNFCSKCGSMLWLYDSSWPELIHPFASAIDSELEVPDELTCIKLDSKPDYVRLPEGKKKVYEGYPPDSLEEETWVLEGVGCGGKVEEDENKNLYQSKMCT